MIGENLNRLGELDRAIKFLAQFRTEKELLEKTDLYGLMCVFEIS